MTETEVQPDIRQCIGDTRAQSWCYLLVCPRTGDSAIVDPGGSPDEIMALAAGTHVRGIFITHGHRDHVGAVEEVRKGLKVPVWVHPGDIERLPALPDSMLTDRALLMVGELRLAAIHTPGHTPGSTCLRVGDHLIAGDTLFPGGPGHTRSNVDFEEEVRSITERLYSLPDHVVLHPGHGLPTTIGESRREYEAFAARPRTPNLSGDVLWASS